LNSPNNCAASVLLCDIIRTGLPTFSITFDIENVLPDPVTPRKVWYFILRNIPSVSSFIALG